MARSDGLDAYLQFACCRMAFLLGSWVLRGKWECVLREEEMRFAKDLATPESVRVVLAIVNVPLGQRWAKLGGDRPSLLSTAAALILALAALVTGCERKQSDTTDRVFEFKAPIEANLLFISVDTTRADHLGCYGYSRPTSPRIDQLAASGHLFCRHTRPCSRHSTRRSTAC